MLACVMGASSVRAGGAEDERAIRGEARRRHAFSFLSSQPSLFTQIQHMACAETQPCQPSATGNTCETTPSPITVLPHIHQPDLPRQHSPTMQKQTNKAPNSQFQIAIQAPSSSDVPVARNLIIKLYPLSSGFVYLPPIMAVIEAAIISSDYGPL
ncbi:uncharacterized protein MYCFIDRAFT_177382 [Pseudocercospora fijiensis CIRAD86]|uniref:Uncharacterized protein n=1 Tax=Pseudocercospora fijiensis (strain CIRAD86) TaxID=383855 RepID=M2ZMV3_PSEFD|nr:uncharacterized protein MYCFIDRAFT_177382 [Pseudocercospora fijiensis CIRAD86]EME80439.1 hypothetical protein MYCFIDRAFT_177382 [Pseudocercospora fijiensis CIRAD86]